MKSVLGHSQVDDSGDKFTSLVKTFKTRSQAFSPEDVKFMLLGRP